MGAGNQIKAYEEMFRRFQPALVKYAASMLYSVEDAREVVQDVFIKIWQKRDSLEFGEELKSYLYRSVRNQTLNKIQRNRIDTVSLDEKIYVLTQETDLRDDEKNRRLKEIFKQIETLPPSCKEIFMMSRVEGLSHKEIAEILEISRKTVENQVGIALKKIRKGVFKKAEK